MPFNNLSSVNLPNRATGANSKKPYVEFYGRYEKSKLSLSISGLDPDKKEVNSKEDKKKAFEYVYNFADGKEPVIKTPVDFLTLRLDDKSYFIDDRTLFELYCDAKVVTSSGALPSKVFTAVCDAFCSLWKEKIVFEDLNKYSRFVFRIVVLPFQLLSQEKQIEYKRQDESIGGELFEDCFGNSATDYPSTPTLNAKFVSYDDEAFSINCRVKKEFYQNLGVGNESFDKVNLPPDNVKIAGLEWYFFDLTNPTLVFDENGSGIYDKLRENYEALSREKGRSVQEKSVLKVICTKRAQAKIEVLLDENLTLDQLDEMFSRVPEGFNSYRALECLIVDGARDIIWTDYITAIRYFMSGIYFDRGFLVQRFTRIFRSKLWEWIKNVKAAKKDVVEFFDRSQFCLKLLTKTESGINNMNKNEEYAYKIGVIAGKYMKFKQTTGETNNSTKDILTYSKYDREHLRFVYKRVGIGLNLSKANTDELSKSIKNDTPKDEIDDAQANEDYSYFFYKGVFENI